MSIYTASTPGMRRGLGQGIYGTGYAAPPLSLGTLPSLAPPTMQAGSGAASIYGSPSQDELLATAEPEPDMPPIDPEDPGLFAQARDVGLGGLAMAGNALDLPGSMLRDVLTWLPGGIEARNPFDQLLSPFSDKNRTTGEEILRLDSWQPESFLGSAGKFVAGTAAEIALDPLTYMTFGASAIGKGGKLASKAGFLDDAVSVASKKATQAAGKDVTMGFRRAKQTVSARELAQNFDAAANAGKFDDAGALTQTALDELLGKYNRTAEVPAATIDELPAEVIAAASTPSSEGMDRLVRAYNGSLPRGATPITSIDEIPGGLLDEAIGGNFRFSAPFIGEKIINDISLPGSSYVGAGLDMLGGVAGSIPIPRTGKTLGDFTPGFVSQLPGAVSEGKLSGETLARVGDHVASKVKNSAPGRLMAAAFDAAVRGTKGVVGQRAARSLSRKIKEVETQLREEMIPELELFDSVGVGKDTHLASLVSDALEGMIDVNTLQPSDLLTADKIEKLRMLQPSIQRMRGLLDEQIELVQAAGGNLEELGSVLKYTIKGADGKDVEKTLEMPFAYSPRQRQTMDGPLRRAGDGGNRLDSPDGNAIARRSGFRHLPTSTINRMSIDPQFAGVFDRGVYNTAKAKFDDFFKGDVDLGVTGSKGPTQIKQEADILYEDFRRKYDPFEAFKTRGMDNLDPEAVKAVEKEHRALFDSISTLNRKQVEKGVPMFATNVAENVLKRLTSGYTHLASLETSRKVLKTAARRIRDGATAASVGARVIGDNERRVRDEAVKAFGPEAERFMPVMQARAQVWADANGKSQDDWFSKLKIESGTPGAPVGDVLDQGTRVDPLIQLETRRMEAEEAFAAIGDEFDGFRNDMMLNHGSNWERVMKPVEKQRFEELRGRYEQALGQIDELDSIDPDTFTGFDDVAPAAGVEPSIVRAMESLSNNARGGGMVGIPELRAQLGLPKEEFDAMILRESAAGNLALHKYDRAGMTPQDQLEQLVSDEGKFFNTVSIRNPDVLFQDIAKRKPTNALTDVLYHPAYHGSPHKFNKFSLSAMGTGEGAQAYGWGMYFTDTKDIAEHYREKLSRNASLPDAELAKYFAPGSVIPSYGGFTRVVEFRPSTGNSKWSVKVQPVIKKGDEWIDDPTERPHFHSTMPDQREVEKVLPDYKPGAVYEVDLAPSQEEYLQLDLSFEEQSPQVRVALRQAFPGLAIDGLDGDDLYREISRPEVDYMKINQAVMGLNIPESASTTKLDIYQAIEDSIDADRMTPETLDKIAAELESMGVDRRSLNQVVNTVADIAPMTLGPAGASKRLREIGVRGVKFLDGNSRGRSMQAQRTLATLQEEEQKRLARLDIIRQELSDNRGNPGLTASWFDKMADDIRVKESNLAKIRQDIEKAKKEAQGSYNYVIFDDADIEIKSILEQRFGANNAPRGQVQFMDDNKAVITAFKSADISTLVHETGHVFRRDLEPELLNQAAKALGVTDVNNWSRQAEEQFASGFERYMRDGKAPTPELKSVFDRFKNWLTTIYRSIVGTPLEADINPELRGVFDKMLGGGKEVVQGAAVPGRNEANLFSQLKTMGLDHERFQNKLLDDLGEPAKQLRQQMFEEDRSQIAAQIVQQFDDEFGGLDEAAAANLRITLENDPDSIINGPLSAFADQSRAATVTEAIKSYREYTPDKVAPQRVLEEFAIDSNLARDIGSINRKFKSPEEASAITAAYDALTDLFKSNVTAPFPSFHIRNLMSGFTQNVLNDVYDPTQTGFNKYFQPYKDTMKLLSGDLVEEARKIPAFMKRHKEWTEELGEKAKSMTDVELNKALDKRASDEIRNLILSRGLVDSPGMHNDLVADAGGRVVDQLLGRGFDENAARNIPVAGRIPGVRTIAENIRMRGQAPEGTTRAQAWNPLNIPSMNSNNANWWVRWGRATGDVSEQLLRSSPFIAMLKQGIDPDEAARRVAKMQIDYSDLTRLERERIRRVAPFYSFNKGATKQLLDNLSRAPGGKTAMVIKAAENASGNDPGVPEYVRDGMNIPLGANEEGDQSYLTGLGLMHEAPLQMLSPTLGGTLFNMAGMLNPVPKMIAEMATNQSLFQDGPGGGGRSLDDLDPLLGRTLSNIGNTLGITDRETPVEIPFSKFTEHLLANSPASRLLSQIRTAFDDRKTLGQRLVSGTTGFKVSTVDAKQRDAVLREQLEQLMRDMGGRTFSQAYIPENLMAELEGDDLERAMRLQEALRLINNRRRKANTEEKE